ncbi:MAG: hypothetical protein HKN16_03015, partial [Saprospiraceae bacterium]|nr:hypothetical protein [Saprospiraceae bacterium]
RGETLLESDNLFYQLDRSPKPTRVVETKSFVLLQDLDQGTFVFDQFGKFIRPLSIGIPNDFQIWNDMIVFYEDSSLVFHSLKNSNTRKLTIPNASNVEAIQFWGNQVYLQKDGKIHVYEIRKLPQ